MRSAQEVNEAVEGTGEAVRSMDRHWLSEIAALRQLGSLSIAFWTTGVALPLAWALVYRDGWSVDGIAYLDIAEKYAAGQWREAINGYWSPLYSWLLAVGLRLMPHARADGLAVAHLAEALVSLLGVVCVWLALRNILAAMKRGGELDGVVLWGAHIPLLLILGYGAFIFGAFYLISPKLLTPDRLTLGLATLGVSCILRDMAETRRPGAWVVTGLVLGLAYLARVFVVVWAPLLWALSYWLDLNPRGLRRGLVRAACYGAGFLIVAGPWIAALSWHEGRPTFGEAGKTILLAHVSSRPVGSPGWPVVEEGGSVRIWELPFPTTIPEHYDLSLRNQGRAYEFSLSRHLRVLAANTLATLFGFSEPTGLYWPLWVLLLLGLWAHKRTRRRARARGGEGEGDVENLRRVALFLILGGGLGVGLYLPLHVEIRYVAVFFLLWALGVAVWLHAAEARHQYEPAAAGRWFAVGLAVLLWALPVLLVPEALRDRHRVPRDAASSELQNMSSFLRSLGPPSDRRIAFVGSAYPLAGPAYLAQAQVIASIYPPQDWDAIRPWSPTVPVNFSSPAGLDRIFAALRRARVTVLIVGAGENLTRFTPGWRPVPGTGWMYYDLRTDGG